MDTDNPVLDIENGEQTLTLESFHQKLLVGMAEVPPEFNKIFVDNLEDILA